jgi:DNA-directed RNA polymerase subunit RPC12/RpoP
MYTCSMCKNETEGKVAFKNGAGSFCPECKAIIHARSAEGVRARSAALNGHCVWCGEKITPSKMQVGKEDENVCYPCTTRRDWLLKAIRLSDRPARYVARTEERERPMREEREKAAQAAAQPKPVAENVPNEQEARLRRLELMLNKLTQALGV